jgi:hypothetical protein
MSSLGKGFVYLQVSMCTVEIYNKPVLRKRLHLQWAQRCQSHRRQFQIGACLQSVLNPTEGRALARNA